jgi:formylglycine-generating enzyme required for sulfatase activity
MAAFTEAAGLAKAAGIPQEEALRKAQEALAAKEGDAKAALFKEYQAKLGVADGHLAKEEWDAAIAAYTEAESFAEKAGLSPDQARQGRGRAEAGKRIATRYPMEVRQRFEKLLGTAAWKAAEPPMNEEGTLEAVHQPTGLVFVLVPGGTFRMGSVAGDPEADDDEKPPRDVTVPAYLLCKTECTQAAWKKVGAESPSFFSGDALPVERVSWASAHAWCGALKLRLPSESEWEYACRAGTTTAFSTGDSKAGLQGFANVADAHLKANLGDAPERERGYVYTEDVDDGHSTTAPAGTYGPNAFGLVDMHGNVWEWCEDKYHTSYEDEGVPDDGSAWTGGDSPYRILRGGSWSEPAKAARVANRASDKPESRFADTGFRPAAGLPE